jgi:hypothetical protein
MKYFWPLCIKEISGGKVGTLLWVDKEDLNWAPGQKGGFVRSLTSTTV